MSATTQAQPDVRRSAPIVRGRGDYASVLLRLIGMDAYKVSRRRLSNVLLLVGAMVTGGIFLAIGIAVWHMSSQPATDFVPANCAVFPHNIGCIHHPATLADMQHEKQRLLASAGQFLNMPGMWNVEDRFIVEALVVLAIMLAGALVGGEYSLGTVRLMFTRGPTRVQFLLAKIGTMVAYVVPSMLLLMLLGMVVAGTMAHLAGIGAGFGFVTGPVFGHFVLFLLLAMLYWLAFMMMALFFGTVGRSTVAGIVGPLVWLATELLLGNIITALTAGNSGSLVNFLSAIPGYFLGTNLASLLQGQRYALGVASPAPYSAGHSLVIVALYMIVFIGISCWLTARRDVTH